MNDEKLETLFNLALSATNEEREKSQILNIGYEADTKQWDVILKYSGDLKKYNFPMVELYNGYATMHLSEKQIEEISKWPEIEYIEKPKRLYFERVQGIKDSCISIVQVSKEGLTGKGVCVAIIDSGIDVKHHEFIKPDGTSRILYFWDQTVEGNPPKGYDRGHEYTQEALNALLNSEEDGNKDTTGHGTAVAAIAAGNDGVAYESSLIVVRLGAAKKNSFPRTTELMQGVDYVLKKTVELGMPVAMNLSFGNTYGAHDGYSLLETYLDGITGIWKNVIVTGTGNEGNEAGHTEVFLEMGKVQEIPFNVQNYETGLNIQIWKSYLDDWLLEVIAPNGSVVGDFQQVLGTQRFFMGDTEILLYYGAPGPYHVSQEIFIDFIPKTHYIQSGQWRFRIRPERIRDGKVELWMPSHTILNQGTRFLYPIPKKTFTIPSTARKVISVGAYDTIRQTFADFSGRGMVDGSYIKPELAAPGVHIRTAAAGGQYTQVTGTSFAAPFVTGSAALLMEYGIVKGQDPYLYGEKIKAYLCYGARPLPAIHTYPNDQIGWGTLCVGDSLPDF